MTKLRRFSQFSFFVFFLYLFLRTIYTGKPTLDASLKIFLKMDPLISIVTFIHTKGFWVAFASISFLSILLVVFTFFLGRFFCSWICPFGTLQHLASLRKEKNTKKIEKGIYNSNQRIKYLVLMVLIVLSIFTVEFTGIFDPISLLIRSFSITVFPLIHFVMDKISLFFFDHNIPLLSAFSETSYDYLREKVLPYNIQHFSQNLLIGLIFVGILLLNRIRPRFWCRYVCPLGALLGLLSRFSRIQRVIDDNCTKCNLCNISCQGAAADITVSEWKPQECMLCFNCLDQCPENAISFKLKSLKTTKETIPITLPDRRKMILSLAASTIAAPLFLLNPNRLLTKPNLIRPPGALPENDFITHCVKCSECMKVCPTNGLQPTFLEAGIEGIWSPILNMRIGYCEFSCTLCGQACPTGAIQRLTEAEKRHTKIGLASIDVSRCLPYAYDTPCIVCQEHCPVSPKAIELIEKNVKLTNNKNILLKFPRVNQNLCIGCGICENKCPVTDDPAIKVTSIKDLTL